MSTFSGELQTSPSLSWFGVRVLGVRWPCWCRISTADHRLGRRWPLTGSRCARWRRKNAGCPHPLEVEDPQRPQGVGSPASRHPASSMPRESASERDFTERRARSMIHLQIKCPQMCKRSETVRPHGERSVLLVQRRIGIHKHPLVHPSKALSTPEDAPAVEHMVSHRVIRWAA